MASDGLPKAKWSLATLALFSSSRDWKLANTRLNQPFSLALDLELRRPSVFDVLRPGPEATRLALPASGAEPET
jgi:hypothetical protein